jgi:hypothetical protein
MCSKLNPACYTVNKKKHKIDMPGNLPYLLHYSAVFFQTPAGMR